MTEPAPIRYHTCGTVPKADDLEIAVRTAEVDGEQVVDIRDFVPSLGLYGRGVTIPATSAFALAQLVANARTR